MNTFFTDVVNLLAGMGAGPTSDIGLFPLDSLKTSALTFLFLCLGVCNREAMLQRPQKNQV